MAFFYFSSMVAVVVIAMTLVDQGISVMLVVTAGALTFVTSLFSVMFVPPGKSQILMGFSSVKRYDVGFHVVSPFSWRVGSCWGKKLAPCPGSKFVLDPAPVPFHTADRVQGTIDISVECTVLEWDATVCSADHSNLKWCACKRVNNFLSTVMVTLPADECTYGEMSRRLNEPESIAALESVLQDLYLSVRRVAVDPEVGVKLCDTYKKQREDINQEWQTIDAKERLLNRQLQIDDLKRRNEQKQYEFELEKKKLQAEQENEILARKETSQAQTQVEVQRLRAEGKKFESLAEVERVRGLVECGLEPQHIVQIAIVREGREMFKNSGDATKLVSVPPSLLGLHLFNHKVNEGWASVPGI